MITKYWTQEYFDEINKAQNFQELLAVAYEVLDSIPKPVCLVSGPISTGGHGSIKENLAVLGQAILKLEWQGKNVFNQLPFEDKFGELAKGHDGYFMPILEDFFLPIFKSGRIDEIWFLHGWESSTGARWEYEMAEKLGIKRELIEASEKI